MAARVTVATDVNVFLELADTDVKNGNYRMQTEVILKFKIGLLFKREILKNLKFKQSKIFEVFCWEFKRFYSQATFK